MKKTCHIGGILKNRFGYGFRISFKNIQEAEKYKEQCQYIIEVDKYKIQNENSYYENNSGCLQGRHMD